MGTELDGFLEQQVGPSAKDREELRVMRDLLVFEYAGERYALPASAVDAVVPWREPTRVPGAEQRILGVFQDRGRIVVLMAHPAGRVATDVVGRRIIICNTVRGYVGVPASVTNAVSGLELQSEPTPLSVHDSRFGPFTFLEAEQWIQAL